jgi:hypothetical protein
MYDGNHTLILRATDRLTEEDMQRVVDEFKEATGWTLEMEQVADGA